MRVPLQRPPPAVLETNPEVDVGRRYGENREPDEGTLDAGTRRGPAEVIEDEGAGGHAFAEANLFVCQICHKSQK